MAIEHLGEPLTGSYSIAGGEARLYERGATINGLGGEVVVTFNLPMIGTPQIAVGDPSSATPLDPSAVPIAFGAPEVVIPSGATPPTYGLPSTAPLEERQLYDVAVRGDDGQWRAI